MKANQFFAIALAALTFSACSNDADDVQGTSSMKLQIAVDAPSTYAIQDPGTATAPTLNSVIIRLKAGSSILETRTLSSTEIASALSSSGFIIEQVSDAATTVSILANGVVGGENIADFQVGFANIPFAGEGTITYTSGDVNADGHKLKKVSVQLTSQVARLEVVGGINVNPTDNGIYAVDVEAIYVNNYLKTITSTTPTFYTNNAAGDWVGTNTFLADKMTNEISTTATTPTGSFYGTDHNVGVLTGKADVYQLFPAKTTGTTAEDAKTALPHLVLKVNVYKTSADYTAHTPIADKHWITITSFKLGTNVLTDLKAGNIYKIDLASLKDSFEINPIDPTDPIIPVDPDPEETKTDLQIKVEVTPWVVNTITPNI